MQKIKKSLVKDKYNFCTKWGVISIMGILLLCILIFRQYIIHGYYFFSQGLLSDLLRANLPAYYHLFDNIKEGGFLWSWQMGIGTSMFTHADIYFDPFTYILFLFGRSNIPNMMIWLFVVKLICEGLAFSAYLNYFRIDKRAIAIAAILYSFCGYSLIMGSNFALGTILVYAPIVLLGIEKWLESGKVRLLALSLFLTCIYSYYYFYNLGIILVVYICFRMYQKKQNFVPKILILGGIAFAVILCSAFTLFPQIQLIPNSARVGVNKEIAFGFPLFVPQISVWLTAIIRTLGNNLLGNPISSTYLGNNYFANHDYFQNSCFVSSCFIILMAHYWFYEKRKRKQVLAIFMLLSIAILFPLFSYILNAFSTTNTRWMYIVAIIQCLGIAFSIDSLLNNSQKKGGICLKPLLSGILLSFACIIAGYLVLSSSGGDINIFLSNGKKHLLVTLTIYICMIAIYILQKKQAKVSKKWNQFFIVTIVCLMIVIDIGANYYHFYGSSSSVCNYTEAQNCNYEDTSAMVIQNIQSEDQSFYRINKDFDSVTDEYGIPSDNDAMVQQYYGLKNYNSVNNPNYIEFLQKSGNYVAYAPKRDMYKEAGIRPEEITGSELNYIDGIDDRYQLMGYLGVKYFLTREKDINLPHNFKFLSAQGNVNVYANENYYPLAFCNQGLMSLEEFDSLADSDKDIALLNYTILDSKVNSSLLNSACKNQKELTKIAKEKQEAFELVSFSPDNVRFNINVTEGTEYLSFTIPFDKGWKVFIDGLETTTEKINLSLLGTEISAGLHEVEIKYEPFVNKVSLIISILALCPVSLTIRKWNIWFKSLENGLNQICIKVKNGTIMMGNRVLLKTNLLKLLKYFSLLVISFSFTLISLYVFHPSTFFKNKNMEAITDWSQLDINGYDIEGNNFTATKDDAGISVPVDIDYTEVRVILESIGFVGDNSNHLNIQMYFANPGEALDPDDVIIKNATDNELQLAFRNTGKKHSALRLDFGLLENDNFTLKQIQLINIAFQMFAIDFFILFGGMAICFIILCYLLNKYSKLPAANVNRDTNIELCRVICMILLIAHHCVLHGGVFAMNGMGANRIISLFFIPVGKLCFDAFLAISCWFLVDQDFRTKRFIRVWFQVFFYSITFTAVAYFIGRAVTFKNFASALLPITGNSHGFAASYLAFYLLLPFLSIISKKISRIQARWLMIILLYFQVGSQIIGSIIQYKQPLSSELLLFVLMYIIALNLKRWPLKICNNKKIMISIFTFIWFSLWFVRYSFIVKPDDRVLKFIMETMCDESSIASIIGGFAFFFFFKELKIKKLPFINLLATGTFGILLIHDHNFFRYVLWKDLLKTESWFDSIIFVFLTAASVIWIYIICFIIDRLRAKYIEEPIMKNPAIVRLYEKSDNIFDKN